MLLPLASCVALVAVAELPVQDPDDPLQLPVTLPSSGPLNLVAVSSPVEGLMCALPLTYFTVPVRAVVLSAVADTRIGRSALVDVSLFCVTLVSVLV